MPRLADFTPLDYLVWGVLQELVYKERCKQFAKDLQNVIRDKWHDVDVRQPESEKPYYIAVEKKTSSSSCKKRANLFSTFPL